MRLGTIECSKWKSLINAAYNKAITAVQRIKDKDGNQYVPDGNGDVTIDYSPSQISTIESNTSTNTLNITTEIADRKEADENLQTQISANATNYSTLKTELDTEVSDRKNADTDLQTSIDAKQGTLTAGSNIYLGKDGTIDANAVLTTVSRASTGAYASRKTRNASGLNIVNQPIFTVGSNLSYDASTGKLDATDTVYTAGSGINISDSNVISAQSSAPTAEQVDLTDGRTVQTAIDAIEDEIGDESTAGSIKYVEKTNTDNIATNATNITALQTSVGNLEASIAGKQDTLTAGTGIKLLNNTLYGYDLVTTLIGGYGGSSSESEQKQATLYSTRRVNYSSGSTRNATSIVNLFKLGTGLVFDVPSTLTQNPTINVDTTAIQPLLTAGGGIDISDATISNSGVRSVAGNIVASTNNPATLGTQGFRNGGFTINTAGLSARIPILGGYFNTATPSNSNSVSNTYTSQAILLGGLKIQWGWFTAYGNSTSYHKATINFRTSYSQANHYTVVLTPWDYNAHDLWSYQAMVETKTTSGFTAHVSNGNSGTDISQDCRVMWLAIGY